MQLKKTYFHTSHGSRSHDSISVVKIKNQYKKTNTRGKQNKKEQRQMISTLNKQRKLQMNDTGSSKTGGELVYFGKLSCSCFTCDTHHVTEKQRSKYNKSRDKTRVVFVRKCMETDYSPYLPIFGVYSEVIYIKKVITMSNIIFVELYPLLSLGNLFYVSDITHEKIINKLWTP